MFCQHCGANLEPNTVFCPACGHQQVIASGGPPPPPLPGGNLGPPLAPFIPPVMAKAQTGQWISQAWEVVKTDIGLFMGITLIQAIIGGAVPLILQGSMHAGFYIACMKKLTRGKLEVADLFLGFNFFVQSLLAVIVIGVFAFLGLLACVIPARVVIAVYIFSYLFIVDKRMDFWTAMQASHSVVKHDYVGFSLFVLALVGVNILGLLCCIVGVLVTAPLSFMAVTIAYRELVGFEPNTV